MSSTTEVLRRHHEALLAGDVDTLLAQYAPEITILRAGEVIKGLDGVRAAFSKLPAGFMNVVFDNEIGHGEYHLKIWHHPNTGVRGSDVFRVVDGKIVFQSVVLAAPAA